MIFVDNIFLLFNIIILINCVQNAKCKKKTIII